MAIVGALAVSAMAQVSQAAGACYFTGGGCGIGTLGAGGTTPWTGNYVSTYEWVENHSATTRNVTIGVRACGTCSGTQQLPISLGSGSTGVWNFWTASRQRWCRNIGPSSGSFKCGFG